MKSFKCKITIIVAIVMSLLVFVTPIFAQSGEIMKGRIDGEQSARSNVNGTLWLAIGCLGGLLGIAVAYIYEPSPSATMLLGKSPEYVAAYTDSYKMTAKKIQTNKAWTGCIAGTLLYVVLVVLSTTTTGTVQ